jgi:hypothetical protein
LDGETAEYKLHKIRTWASQDFELTAARRILIDNCLANNPPTHLSSAAHCAEVSEAYELAWSAYLQPNGPQENQLWEFAFSQLMHGH